VLSVDQVGRASIPAVAPTVGVRSETTAIALRLELLDAVFEQRGHDGGLVRLAAQEYALANRVPIGPTGVKIPGSREKVADIVGLYYVAHWNADAEPFTWIASADEILAKVRWVQTSVKQLVENNSK
jgi:hypothetical protein